MEILNRNQRRSAMWRLLFLGLIIVGLTVAAIASMQRDYGSGDVDEIEKLEKKLEEREKYWKGIDQNHRNENRRLEREINDLRKEINSPNEVIKDLNREIKIQEKTIKSLETELANRNNN